MKNKLTATSVMKYYSDNPVGAKRIDLLNNKSFEANVVPSGTEAYYNNGDAPNWLTNDPAGLNIWNNYLGKTAHSGSNFVRVGLISNANPHNYIDTRLVRMPLFYQWAHSGFVGQTAETLFRIVTYSNNGTFVHVLDSDTKNNDASWTVKTGTFVKEAGVQQIRYDIVRNGQPSSGYVDSGELYTYEREAVFTVGCVPCSFGDLEQYYGDLGDTYRTAGPGANTFTFTNYLGSKLYNKWPRTNRKST